MSNRRSDECGGDRTARPTPRHLYLVLDDWKLGYSIRKIDLSADFDYPNPGWLISGEVDDDLLPPAIFRLKAQRMLPMYFAAAFDTKILAMHPVDLETDCTLGIAPSFDVHRYGPQQNPDVDHTVYIPVGCRLFALAGSHFEVLYPPRLDGPDEGWEAGVWSWFRLPNLPLPFPSRDVTSSALHPDGRTIFVSTRAGTFTFDTEEVTLEVDDWSQGLFDSQWERSHWMLPFSGRAYFDSRLDAWVGLHRNSVGHLHLCSCDVVSAYNDKEVEAGQSPTLELCMDDLFLEQEHLVGATLVYIGGRSHYCLVQCVAVKDNKKLEDDKPEEQSVSRPYFLRLSTFSLKYSKNGALIINNSLSRMYELPESVSESLAKNPVAFWM